MKRHLINFFLAMPTISQIAQSCNESRDYFFYIKVDSGVSCSQNANITAPYPPWYPATQGYNAKLGNCPIAGISLGYELLHTLDLEVSIANRSIFKYNKFQTPTNGGDSYTREFDLSVTSILFSANLLGQNIRHLNYQTNYGKIYPMIGAGIGASDLLITNFRTTGLPPTGDSSPYSSFSSENQYTLHRNFTYLFMAGFEYSHSDRWAIGTGYRWFNAGQFKGPQYLRAANGSAVDVGNDTWNMRFRANEWFIEFKIFI